MPKAKDIMTLNPLTCKEQDTIYDAVQVMKRKDTGVVPIVDQDEICTGVITDRDICLQVVLNGLDPKSTLLADIMSRDLVACNPEDDLRNVLDLMQQRQIKRIVVVDQDDHCFGIISEADIAQRVDDKGKVGELAQSIYV